MNAEDPYDKNQHRQCLMNISEDSCFDKFFLSIRWLNSVILSIYSSSNKVDQ